MITLYYGTDIFTTRSSAFARAEAQNATVVVIDAESFTEGAFKNALGSASLFGEQFAYVIDTPSADEQMQSELNEVLADFADSEVEYIVIEGGLTQKELAPYKKVAKTIEKCMRENATPFNVFSLADALARKDKKALWTGIHEAKRNGIVTEQIIGTLWWQLSTLRLAAQTTTPEEAGIKSYPYNKAKRALQKFPLAEVEDASAELLQIQFEARSDGLPLDLSFERWVLEL